MNDEKIPIKNFEEYVRLFYEHFEYIKIDEHWEVAVAVAMSNGRFQQMSLVTGYATTGGGSHVENVTQKILSSIVKKNGIRAKSTMDILINCKLNEVAFTATREQMTLRPKKIQPKCVMPEAFVERVHAMLQLPLHISTAKKECRRPRENSTAKEQNVGDYIHVLAETNTAATMSPERKSKRAAPHLEAAPTAKKAKKRMATDDNNNNQ